MDGLVKILTGILRDEVCGAEIDPGPVLALSQEQLEQLIDLAKRHSVLQFLGDALGKCPETRDLPVTRELLQQTLGVVRHTAKIEKEQKRICRELEKASIPYIRLKGARIRPLYPEPWMRSSCDNDILVHQEQVEAAAQLLSEKLDYRKGEKAFHDISLYSKSGVHLELHFNIRGRDPKMDAVLDHVWDPQNVRPCPGSCEFLQTEEFFMFHHVAHMANHVLGGGCGIRPFLDLFLLNKKLDYDRQVLLGLCRQARIEVFYENACKLTEVWFEGRPHSSETEHLEAFILSGGSYGKKEREVAISQNQAGSRWGFVWGFLFYPYERLVTMFPSLEGHRWLTPVYQVWRWLRALFRGKFFILRRGLRESRRVDDGLSDEMGQMLRENGLL